MLRLQSAIQTSSLSVWQLMFMLETHYYVEAACPDHIHALSIVQPNNPNRGITLSLLHVYKRLIRYPWNHLSAGATSLPKRRATCLHSRLAFGMSRDSMRHLFTNQGQLECAMPVHKCHLLELVSSGNPRQGSCVICFRWVNRISDKWWNVAEGSSLPLPASLSNLR